MKKKFLIGILSALLAVICIFAVSSCAASNSKAQIKTGDYIVKKGAFSPYIYFDTETKQFCSGASLSFNYAVKGKYEAKNNSIIMFTDDPNQNLSIELEVISDIRLKIVHIKDDADIISWLQEGDVLIYRNVFSD